ncbi:3-oxoacyl-ACP reductase family protein [Paenibacillus camerounensis]|uniref:3-oxoacyl-ACP reductase family protein n=1 Tax=Paenibacillus camerounensis TaxID=1243663 RepID=UPI0005A857DF|nr:3-oxoacyl-ACP reductase family protein [Paenibacillus camerounensis]
MIIDLVNKTVVITGSSRGIGREAAYRFAREGANVIINYKSSYEQAESLLQEIKKINKNCIAVKADVTKVKEVEHLYQETIKTFGRVDVLLNNAGLCSDNRINMMSEDQWKDIMDVNLNSVFLCSKIFSKDMIKNESGKIINIASMKGQIGCEGQTNYSASKAGVIGFTKALAKELGHFKISVNAVCPGFIVTDLNRHNEEKQTAANSLSVIKQDNALDDLMNFLVFLLSDHCKGVSGRIFNIDSRIK